MENKTGKYFKYAIGEIVLVIIGILIALQINNANEKSKEIKFAIKQLETLSQNLYNSNKNGNAVEFLQAQDSVLQYLRRGDEKLKPDFTRWYDRLPLHLGKDLKYEMNENFDLVINLEKSFPEKYMDVLESIKNIDTYYKNVQSEVEMLDYIERQNYNILSNKFDWYDDFSKEALDKRRNFYLIDFLFQNRLSSYISNFKMYASVANRIKLQKAKIWSEVAVLKSNTTNKALKLGYNEMGLVELSKIDCSATAQKNQLPSFFTWNLVYNSTNDTIAITTNDNHNYFHYLNPNSFDLYNANKEIKISKNMDCIAKYKSVINGYIIIE